MSQGPIVVAVLSHRDPPLLKRLVARVLEGQRTVVLLHHDPRAAPHGISPSDRVFIVPDAEPCEWGRMSLALAMTRCFASVTRQIPDFEWLLLVSGQDYPSRHLRSTEADLSASSADAMLRYFRVDPQPQLGEHPWQTRCRQRYMRRRRLPTSRRAIPIPRRHPFGADLQLFIGDMWVNLRATAVEHILEQQTRHSDLLRYFSSCPVPDEGYVPTLLLNDAGALRIVNERKRFIDWTHGSAHPRTLDRSDLPALVRADAYFARKVDSTRSRQLLDDLDRASDPA